MLKYVFATVLVGGVLVVDALVPFGEEPIWSSLRSTVASIPDIMREHEESFEREARSSSGKIGVRPLFGEGRSYVETGLPSGPVLGVIERQIREGEAQLRDFKPPQLDSRDVEWRVRR